MSPLIPGRGVAATMEQVKEIAEFYKPRDKEREEEIGRQEAYLERTRKMLEMLRSAGVRTFKGEAPGHTSLMDVEFFPPEDASMPEAKHKKNEIDVCVCGHPEHAHMNGFCVEGCDAEKCNPKKEK